MAHHSDPPAWLAAAHDAARRLAAEAGADVDDILGHPGETSPGRLAHQVARLEESADLTEVATDLAGLLWAECGDVPPIATILDHPSARTALQAVSDARRHAARRLSDGWIPREAVGADPFRDAWDDDEVAVPSPTEREPAPAAASPAPAPVGTGPVTASIPAVEPDHRPAKGAALAGAGAAAAAILLFGRRLRRA